MFMLSTNEEVKNFESALMSVFEKERTRIQFIKNLICVINRCSRLELLVGEKNIFLYSKSLPEPVWY